jgi:hypothetical protein
MSTSEVFAKQVARSAAPKIINLVSRAVVNWLGLGGKGR